jgi:hypothetical protein
VQHEIDAQIEAEIEAMYRPPDLDGPASQSSVDPSDDAAGRFKPLLMTGVA